MLITMNETSIVVYYEAVLAIYLSGLLGIPGAIVVCAAIVP